MYEGGWSHGRPHGWGKMVFSPGVIYDGNWTYGVADGRGRMEYGNGSFYAGTWVKGRYQEGDLRFESGNIYSGPFQAEGKMHGQGRMVYSDGAYYTGMFVDGAMEGVGEMVFAAQGVRYRGEWAQGTQEGRGAVTHKDGKLVFGVWKAGELVEALPADEVMWTPNAGWVAKSLSVVERGEDDGEGRDGKGPSHWRDHIESWRRSRAYRR